MSENEELPYNNSHRALLQAFIARGTMTFDQARPILAAILSVHEDRQILEADVTEADFDTHVSVLNTALSPLDLEIRNAFTQTTPRTEIYALVNTTSDTITQIATTHTADEIAFVKRLLDEMFETNNTISREIMAIKSIPAINLHKPSSGRTNGINGRGAQASSSDQGLSKLQAEKMLKSLVQEGWFEKSGDWYLLSPRALMELRGWLLETYNEPEDEDGEGRVDRIKKCEACNQIITMGQRCPSRQCPCRLHDNCTQSFFRARRENKCPLCNTEWTGRDFVGVRAAVSSSRVSGGKVSNGIIHEANDDNAARESLERDPTELNEQGNTSDG